MFQNKILRMVSDAPWYTIYKGKKIPFVTETLRITYSRQHSTLIFHPNSLVSDIPQHMLPDRQHSRLKRKRHTDILTQ